MPKPKGLGIKPISPFVGDTPDTSNVPAGDDPKPQVHERRGSFELSASGTHFRKEEFQITNEGIANATGTNLAEIRYEDLEEVGVLGKGASGTVKKMLHKPSGQFIALKCIQLNEHGNRSQLVNELRSLVGADTPFCTQLYNAFAIEGSVAIALEYFDCGGVEDLLEKKGRFPESVAAKIIAQTLRGLDYLHSKRKQVHRDLKPANILIKSDGVAKVSDFGISKTLDQTLAMAATFIGTVTYMSPERLAGEKYSFSSDIWSIGVIVMEFLTGQNPFPPQSGGGFFQLMTAVSDGPLPTLDAAEYSPECLDFVKKCMQKNHIVRPPAFKLLKHPWLAMHESTGPSLAEFIGGGPSTSEGVAMDTSQ